MEYSISYEKAIQQRKRSRIHLHNQHELYCLLEGDTKYFIGDESFHLQAGNFIFVPSGMLHQSDSEDCLHNERIVIMLDDSICGDDSMTPIINELSTSKLICIAKNDLPSVMTLIKKLENENAANNIYKDAMMKTYIRELLTLICRLKSSEKQQTRKSDKLIYDISDYISNNCADDITLSSLGRRFALSQSHLSRKFKSVLGVGLNEYIRYVRILKAEKLLAHTNMSITQIAEQCGFHDSNYFSTVFKKTIGINPHKYARINQKS